MACVLLGEVLWTAGDAAVDYYFSREPWAVVRRQAARFVKRRLAKGAFDHFTDNVFQTDDKKSLSTRTRLSKIPGETSRANGRRGGRPPYRHLGISRHHPYGQRARNQQTQTPPTFRRNRTMATQAGSPGNVSSSSADMVSPPQQRERRNADDAGTSGQAAEGAGQFTASMGNLGGSNIRQTESHIFQKQLTFKHYLTYSAHSGWVYEQATTASTPPFWGEMVYKNSDWTYLPYTWLCSYMSKRDYQGLNIAYKRWKVKEFGFDAHHIVPFLDDLTSTGGNVTPSVEISPLTYFEAFCDKYGELPWMNVTEADLPNEKMSVLFASRSKSTLKPACLYFGNWGGASGINLEQSPAFEIIDAGAGFSFQHNVHPVDQQWRHALLPMNANYQMFKDNVDNHDGYMTTILGRNNCNSGLLMAQNKGKSRKLLPSYPGDNLLYDSWEAHYPHSPPPKILLRVPEIMRSSDTGVPYGFVMHVTSDHNRRRA